MQRTKQYYLKLISGLEHWDIGSLLYIFKAKYDPVKGFGFIDTERINSSIISNLVYQTISIQRLFKLSENRFLDHELELFFNVPFLLDSETGLLEAGLGGEKLRKLISVLGRVFEYQITIEDIFININKFVNI